MEVGPDGAFGAEAESLNGVVSGLDISSDHSIPQPPRLPAICLKVANQNQGECL
ncbi:MAG: hypothetical protein AAFQ89_17115 [Cyanobacteria bacterium J06626_18]